MGEVLSQGEFLVSEDILVSHWLGEMEWLLTFSAQWLGILNILQCLGQSHTIKNDPTQNANSPSAENYLLLICTSMFCSSWGWSFKGGKSKGRATVFGFSHGFPISWYTFKEELDLHLFITSVHRFKGGFPGSFCTVSSVIQLVKEQFGVHISLLTFTNPISSSSQGTYSFRLGIWLRAL